MSNQSGEIVKKYLDEFPNLPNKTLARKIYEENKLVFKDVESIRTIIRNYKGSHGKSNLKSLSTDKYLTEEAKIKKYNLPESIETIYEPFKIISNKALIFSDVHIPFHSISALTAMFDYTVNMNVDSIILNGDIMDCFSISHFNREPNKTSFIEEVQKIKQFLDELKVIYPNVKIYYKFGNHELRLEHYLMSKAPEIFGLPEFRLEVLLDLYNKKIAYIPENIYIDLNSELPILHGHEFKNGVTSPANPARSLFLRSKKTALQGHNHQTSEHTEMRLDNEIMTCWSLGCLSELNPKYLSLNRWNHGFAIYTKEDEKFWTIQNKRIIKGRVV